MIRSLPDSSNQKSIYLTFDDGPDPLVTPLVIQTLAQFSMQATFFVIAQRAKQQPQLINEVLAQHHRLGNHSFDHRYRHYFASTRHAKEWIARGEADIAALSGAATVGFRPPAGICSPPVKWACKNLRTPLILWNRRCYDAVWGFSERQATALAASIKPGDIVLLHDAQRAHHRQQFALGLTSLCSKLQQRGLTSRAIPSLITART